MVRGDPSRGRRRQACALGRSLEQAGDRRGEGRVHRRWRQQPADAVGHDRGDAAGAAGDHRQAGRLGFEKGHAVGFVDRGPKVKVGAGIKRRQRLARQRAGKAHALAAERRHQGLDFGPRRPVANQQRPPRPVLQQDQRLGQHAVGVELVARPHHADAQQDGRTLAAARGSGLKGRGIDERRQPELVRARSQPGLDAGDVARVHGQHQVGGGQRALDGAMAEPRRTLGAARRVRSLGDHIGHAERPGDDRPSQSGLR